RSPTALAGGWTSTPRPVASPTATTRTASWARSTARPTGCPTPLDPGRDDRTRAPRMPLLTLDSSERETENTANVAGRRRSRAAPWRHFAVRSSVLSTDGTPMKHGRAASGRDRFLGHANAGAQLRPRDLYPDGHWRRSTALPNTAGRCADVSS